MNSGQILARAVAYKEGPRCFLCVVDNPNLLKLSVPTLSVTINTTPDVHIELNMKPAALLLLPTVVRTLLRLSNNSLCAPQTNTAASGLRTTGPY